MAVQAFTWLWSVTLLLPPTPRCLDDDGVVDALLEEPSKPSAAVQGQIARPLVMHPESPSHRCSCWQGSPPPMHCQAVLLGASSRPLWVAWAEGPAMHRERRPRQ